MWGAGRRGGGIVHKMKILNHSLDEKYEYDIEIRRIDLL